MSETSPTLTELAGFVGTSPFIGDDQLSQRRLSAAIARADTTRLPRRSVGDLLGSVLALSARARRAAMPDMNVELDVFAPSGRRAVRMFLPQRG